MVLSLKRTRFSMTGRTTEILNSIYVVDEEGGNLPNMFILLLFRSGLRLDCVQRQIL